MIAYRILLFVVVASIVGVAQLAESATDISAQEPVLKQTKIANSGIDLSYVRVSLKKFDVRVLTASVPDDAQSGRPSYSDRLASGYSLQDYQDRYGALVVLSAGYIDSYSPPTPFGLVKSNGIQISEVHRSWLLDGFLCSDIEHVEIIPISNDATRATFRDCVQSGPLLLLDKKVMNDPTRESVANFKTFADTPYERAFACLADKGDVILGITGKVELQKLISALLEPEFNCRNAIAFTISATAGLRVGGVLLGSDDFLFPSVIAIVPRVPGSAPRAPDNAR